MKTLERTRALSPGLRRRVRRVLGPYVVPSPVPSASALYTNLENKSTVELLALMRHETHRIEKAVYNNILEAKQSAYVLKRDRVLEIYDVLERRGIRRSEPTWEWSRAIIAAFDALESDFINARSQPSPAIDVSQIDPFLEFLQSRRSVRVWSDTQPSAPVLRAAAEKMIDAAKAAPTSGDRQPWRFRIIDSASEKRLLTGVKEAHCTSAPISIFVGMDRRVYGALGSMESGLYIDAGAAIMQMYLLAHAAGFGMCWNHFARDLIESRPQNEKIYEHFRVSLSIPEYVEPVAIVAFGAGRFVPPMPARTDSADLIVEGMSC